MQQTFNVNLENIFRNISRVGMVWGLKMPNKKGSRKRS